MREERRPIWAAFPTIPWGSIGWRMGSGEDYWHAWMPWFKALAVDDRTEYKEMWPEPEGWQGFYTFVETGTLPPDLLERQKRVAGSAQPPNSEEVIISDYYRVIWLVRQYMKRRGRDQLRDDEAFAGFYESPDGSQWRLSAMLKGGISLHRLR